MCVTMCQFTCVICFVGTSLDNKVESNRRQYICYFHITFVWPIEEKVNLS